MSLLPPSEVTRRWLRPGILCTLLSLTSSGVRVGRASLRRKWSNLRELADRGLAQLSAEEIAALLGKQPSELDPEHNDLKAIVSYAVGRGLLSADDLRVALNRDDEESPCTSWPNSAGKRSVSQ